MYERTRTEGWNQLLTTGMAIDGDEAWFSNNIFNGLFRVDLRTEEIQFVTMIPNERIRIFLLYSKCHIWKDQVVLIPANADHMSVYDRKTKEISQYKIVDDKGETVKGFFTSWQRDNDIYFISLRKPIIVRFDVDEQKIDVYSGWDNAIRSRECQYSKFFWGEILVEEGYIYIPCQYMNCICRVDLEHNNSKMIEIDANITGIYTICRCQEKHYISTLAGEVFEVDLNAENVTPKQVGYVAGGFCRSIVIGEDIYFFPKAARSIYRYSTASRKMESCFEDDLYDEEAWKPVARSFYYYNNSYYQMVEKIDDNVWIFMLSNGYLYWLSNGDIKNKREMYCSTNEVPLCILDSDYPEIYVESCDKDNILRNSLSAFLQILDNETKQLKSQEQAIIGEKIYESIIGRRV